MLLTYTRTGNSFQSAQHQIPAPIPDNVLWIDMLQPTAEEDRFLENKLNIEIPTREDMRDIEPSSRLYTESGNCFMTTSLLVGADTPNPTISPVTFILTPTMLATVRYGEPSAFNRFSGRLLRQPNALDKAEDLFFHLMDVVVDRLAEVLETNGHNLDTLSNDVFANRPDSSDGGMMNPNTQDMRQVLKRLGVIGNLVSMARESLVSIARLLSFVGPAGELWLKAESQSHTKTLIRDVRFLTEHADAINNKINFLLDATLGLIDLQQTNTMKVLSVASVVLLPPTLIASIFGMNFANIPGLASPSGFTVAMILIILAGILPYLLFYRKKL